MTRFAWIVPLVVVVAACPRPIDGEPDAGPTDSPFVTCSEVSECPGYDPDAATQIVRCDGVCLTLCNGADEACPDSQFCDPSGTCAVGCRDSSSCGDQLCVGGVCQDGSSECATKCDCDAGEVCTEGQCLAAGTTCNASADCPRGPRSPADDCEAFSCNGFSHQCFDPSPTPCTQASECTGRPGCTGGVVCACTDAGACVPDVPCTIPTEGAACGAENFCDANGDCQALPSCVADITCTPQGLTCNEGSGKCERPQACTTNAQCTSAPNTFCVVADGFCALPTCNNAGLTCDADQDCTEDGRCVTQGTGDACANDNACAADQFCNFTLNPDQCALGCRDASGCPDGQNCNAHVCSDSVGLGFGETCDTANDQCVSPLLCGSFTLTCAEPCLDVSECVACNARNNDQCTCELVGIIAGSFCRPPAL